MKLGRWKDWGIATRLVVIALLPALMMFVVVSLALYFSSREEVREDIQERGRLIAKSLAESSRYGVVSRNAVYLQRTIDRFLEVDRSIAAIEILGPEREPLAANEREAPPDAHLFESVIQVHMLADLEWNAGDPHVSQPEASRPSSGDPKTLGYVRVVMSPGPILEAKRERFYVAVSLVLLATLFSGLAGLYLANLLRRPLAALTAALRQIRSGNYAVRLKPGGAGELGELRSTVVEMAAALNVVHTELENKVAARTDELRRAMDQVMEADAEKRRLISQGNALVEEERRRIAVEIHDDLNAALIFVRLEAERIAALAKEAPEEELQEIARTAERISQTTAQLYASAREIVKRLRPELLDTLGLPRAIEEMVRNYDEAHPDCRFALRASASFPDLRGDLAIAAYRVVQEALSNVVKHAEATHAVVSLAQDDATPTVRITITDDGKGFDTTTKAQSGIGLIGMRERVSGVGGSLSLTSAPGHGTSITIDLPYATEGEE